MIPPEKWTARRSTRASATDSAQGTFRAKEAPTRGSGRLAAALFGRQASRLSPRVHSDRGAALRAVDGVKVNLDSPLTYAHRGAGAYRDEVANLSRNVIVESADHG